MKPYSLNFLLMMTLMTCLRPEPGETWREEADRRIEIHRKGDLTLRFQDAEGAPLAGRTVQIRQTRHAFQFGTCVSHYWLKRKSPVADQYRAFIADHFNTVVAESAMKWPYTEKVRGTHDFTLADQLMAFAEEHEMAVRGHTLFWTKEKYKADWMRNLEGEELNTEVMDHLQAIVPRYRGKLIGWDVNNEMLNAAFFEERIGEGTRERIFRTAHELDPETPLFTNEYSILCEPPRVDAYLKLIRELEEAGAVIGGIGIQEHAAERIMNVPPETNTMERQSTMALSPRCIWNTLDRLGKTGKPIHMTEISFRAQDEEKKADALERFYRTLFAHPDVDVIMLWGFWSRAHFLGGKAALVDADFNLLPAGERLLWLLEEEWWTTLSRETDAQGEVKLRGFYGEYAAEVAQPGSDPVRLPFRLEKGTDTVTLSVSSSGE